MTRNSPFVAGIAFAALSGFSVALVLAEDISGQSPELAPMETPTHWPAEEPVAQNAPPVDQEQLDRAADKTDQWLHYGGDYRNFRHSRLESLRPDTLKDLDLAWAFPTGTTGQFEASPIIYGGVMYVTASENRLFALDARTGNLLWRYDYQYPKETRICCGPVNRGAAIAGDLILMATLDAHLLAFDRTTGTLQWNSKIAETLDGYGATSAPLIAEDLAIVGVAGGEFGIRGFFAAFDVHSGKERWRHYTVPAPGEPGIETWGGDSWKSGGAPTWTTGAYDPDSGTLFWTTGNPAPDFYGDLRPGDNLYSNAVIAVDLKTGKRKWHFQFTPHDLWDYDGNTQLFLVDVTLDGRKIKAVAQANRNGYFYLLERETGKFLRATQYVEQLNWATIDENGRPVVNPKAEPAFEPDFRVCPGNMGGTNGAWSGAYHPELKLVYVSTIESCQLFQKGIVSFVKGMPFLGGMPDSIDAAAGKAYGHLTAINTETGEVAWRLYDRHPMMGGVLSTAGGVVISGNQEGEAIVADAATGKTLWRKKIGGSIRSQPVIYELDGTTYLAIGSGGFITVSAMAGGPMSLPEGGHLFVFKLDPDSP